MTLRSAITCALLAACASAPASAEVVTYQFTGTVSQIMEFDLETGSMHSVAESMLPGTRLALGQAVSGSFSYSTSAPLWDSYTPSYQPGTFKSWGGPVHAALRVEETGLSYQNSLPNGHGVHVTDAPAWQGQDLLTFYTAAGDSPAPHQGLSFVFDDTTGQALGSADIAGLPDLNAFGYSHTLYSVLRLEERVGMHAYINFDSLTRVSPVPEPSVPLLFLTGFGTLALLRRRAFKGKA